MPLQRAKPATSKGIASGHVKSIAIFGAALLLVYFIDLFSSNDLSLFPLYLFPVGIATYSIGNRAGYLACLLASLAWLSAALITSSYSQIWIAVQGMLSRGFVYALTTYLIIKNKKASRLAIEQLNRLKTALPICPGCS